MSDESHDHFGEDWDKVFADTEANVIPDDDKIKEFLIKDGVIPAKALESIKV